MRRVFTRAGALAAGMTLAELRWGVEKGKWRRVGRGVFAEGPEDPTPLDRAVAEVLVSGGVACGGLAGVLHGLDSVTLGRGPYTSITPGRACRRKGMRHRVIDDDRVTEVSGIACTDGMQTLVDLAARLDDLRWEHGLESALRKGLVSVAALQAALPRLGHSRTPGTRRIRRVLANRPAGAAATESLLETLMVQLVRQVPNLGDPVRQFEVLDRHGAFVARLDLAWPDLGLFVELDGQHHAGQPCYDSRRETAVVANTGWLCARFTWTEVARIPTTTARRMAELVEQARRRGDRAYGINITSPFDGGHAR